MSTPTTKAIDALEEAAAMLGNPAGDNATADVYRRCIEAANALRSDPQATEVQPIAWMAPDGAIIMDQERQKMVFGSAAESHTASGHTIPLFAHPPLPDVARLTKEEAGMSLWSLRGTLSNIRFNIKHFEELSDSGIDPLDRAKTLNDLRADESGLVKCMALIGAAKSTIPAVTPKDK
jgi:hypothetical protein